MYDVYDGSYKVTSNPISYNFLLSLFNSIEIPWIQISSLPLGKMIKIDHFTIVRIV